MLFGAVLACWASLILALPQAPSPDLDLHLLPPRLLWVEPDGEDAFAAVEGNDDSRPLVIALASTGLAAGALGFATQAWWEDGLAPFSIRETGALGRDTYAGGSDKFGHMFAALVSMHVVSALYEDLGLDHTRSAWGAAVFTSVLFNGSELIDGFTEFGFEYGDVVANTLGTCFGLAARLVPTFDALFGMRMAYVPTRDLLANEKTLLKFLNDYTGMLFLFDLKLKGVFEVAGFDPGLARFINVGVAYGTDHYSPVKRWEERQRMFGAHLGLNFAEVLRAAGDGDVWVDRIAQFFELYAVGGLSVMLLQDLNNDRWFLNFGISNRLEIPL